ncbi:Phenylacetate-coenzyme A ligase [Pseudodesulfovibrio profundus]|uniref:Phenylacetate-coenzyme A ligase n=1 Tax=Pseudodesulfovibrio profundus TaxID=57320 RepID=A0A2C8F6U6_9BACT|nr:phenylacetate--CoA ligase [Pseudodesulfovibrio profundus]MBC18131.1 phenylacetate--CoA ligase [Desulfovibrio sp.]SOB58107.1 Phenylacetate-coenzyme A ligase [Pseudodesulfovibrio profundus]|tara:strand:- start:251 stop:1537 length:1287 start_codon:yes stop_codon:yes gene_type:complete
MYYDKAENMDRASLESLQLERLKSTLENAKNAPFYKEQLAGINPEDLQSAADITKLPFTTKDDLRSQYPYGMLTRSKDEFVRLHASSGTTGTPTAVFYTQKDLDTWADLMARCMYACGCRKSDVLQNMSGYGLFTGGLGIHYGSERLGMLTVPAGAGNTKRQIKLIRDFNVSVLHIIPSFALYFAQKVEEAGFDTADMPWKIALIGAEPHTEEARRKIEEMMHIKAYNSYGLSEMNGPGVAFECVHQNGMHVWEDAYIAEIIDPTTGEHVKEGEIGELVMTTLTREGMPIIRYRTRDLTRFIPGQCECGRTHRRIDRIAGRADDMMILKGVNIYPMQIEQCLMAMPEVGQNYLIELVTEGITDQLKVKVEVKDQFFVEDMRALQGLQKKIAKNLCNEILITPRVELCQHDSIPKGEGKAVRVVDKREK